MRLDNIHKILFITLSNIGDVILTLPVLSALKQNFPNALLDVVVGSRPKEIFTKDPRVNRIFIYDKYASLKDKLAYLKRLRDERYDIAVDMRGSLMPILIGAKNRTLLVSLNQFLWPKGRSLFASHRGARYLGARHRGEIDTASHRGAGYLGAWHRGERSLPIRDLKVAVLWPRIYKKNFKHKKCIHFSKLPFTLPFSSAPIGNIYIDNTDREKIERLFKEKGVKKDDILIGVSPSCRGLLKQWRIGGFIEVIAQLLKQENHKVILLGDESQIDRAAKIKEVVQHRNLVNLTGKVNLNELFALIERMHVLLTCDSAGMHIACDVGVKVVAIFGPTDPEEYGPTGTDDIVIRKNLKCSPCKKAVCRFNHECMKEIGSGEVLEAVEKMLGKIQRGTNCHE